MIGPRFAVSATCSGCDACKSEHYQVQGDSGFIVSCAHPSLAEPKRIGDTMWTTPSWCPVLQPERSADLLGGTIK